MTEAPLGPLFWQVVANRKTGNRLYLFIQNEWNQFNLVRVQSMGMTQDTNMLRLNSAYIRFEYQMKKAKKIIRDFEPKRRNGRCFSALTSRRT